jgi:hypothetical protein
MIEMNKLRQPHLKKESQNTESKPEKLAKILYGAIVRYVKAQNARNREKNTKFELDSGRSRRVNAPSRKFD